MKLRNKKTGMIGEVGYLATSDGKIIVNNIKDQDEWYEYNSIAELTEDWEDYEEPKEHWCINEFGTPEMAGRFNRENLYDKMRKLVGNDFETKEEAEKAVEKLKAWQRLKDKGFKFNGVTPMEYFIRFTYDKPRQILDNQQHPEMAQQFNKDLAILFGGEE